MQITWEFELSSIIDESPDYTDILTRLIQQESKKMGIFLSYYFRKEGGLVEHVQLKDQIIFLTPTTGHFTVYLTINYYNACLNINSDDKDEMSLSFKILQKENKVNLTGPLWHEREPDEI